MNGQSKYVVCDEHTLGYFDPSGMIDILRSSVLRGAVFEIYPNPKFPSQFGTIRPATPQDFKDYRVMPPPSFQ